MTTNGLRHRTWIAVADNDRCRLLECGITEFGTHHVRVVRQFEDLWPKGRYHDPAAPPDTVHAFQRAASPTRVHQVATTIIKRLTHECRGRHIDTLMIVAPRRLLRSMERLLGPEDSLFRLCEGNLAEFTPTALTVHPRIRSLIHECHLASDA